MKALYQGIGILSASILMLEIAITRLMSVATWHYLAFLVVSIAMFGISVGAIQSTLSKNKNPQSISLYASLAGLSTIISVVVFSYLPVAMDMDFTSLFSMTIALIVFSLPFYFSGVSISLALSIYSKHFAKVYSFDLIGGAIGCFLFLIFASLLDGPSLVILIGVLFCLAALRLSKSTNLSDQENDYESSKSDKSAYFSRIALAVSLLTLVINSSTFLVNQPMIYLHWVKGKEVLTRPSFERWTPISYVSVFPYWKNEPFGWGFGKFDPSKFKTTPQQKFFVIDGQAGTVMTEFHNDYTTIEYLKHDVTNLAHFLYNDASVLVLGAGGGRDILSALAFEQKNITAVELNQVIVDVITKNFADFTGEIALKPDVQLILNEARSYLESSNGKFDIIQASLIDTWAATTSGAYALAENSIYTKEAWKKALERLTDKGVMSFSRWYVKEEPYELYRLTSLAHSTLTEYGIKNPKAHIFAATGNLWQGKSVVTILVSKKPFTKSHIEKLEKGCRKNGFKILLSPIANSNRNLSKLLNGETALTGKQGRKLNVSPPTDNCPFFFNFECLADVRFFDISRWQHWKNLGDSEAHYGYASHALIYCLVACLILAIICTAIPAIKFKSDTKDLPSKYEFLVFAAAGAGFMLIEVASLLRQSVFLGHPTLSMAIVLPTLLVASGAGSLVTDRFEDSKQKKYFVLALILIIVSSSISYFIQSAAGSFVAGLPLIKPLFAMLCLSVPGFFMGMILPMTIKHARRKGAAAVCWLWAVNGAFSILASVLAIAIAIEFGILQAYFTGIAFYFLILIFNLVLENQTRNKEHGIKSSE